MRAESNNEVAKVRWETMSLKERFRVAIALKRITAGKFAKEVDLSPGSLRNIINGAAVHASTRQKITNALGLQLWDDVFVQREVTFPVGLQFLGLSPNEIKEALADFGDAVVAKGDMVEVVKPILVTATLLKEGINFMRDTAPVHATTTTP